MRRQGLRVTESDQQVLRTWSRAGTTPQRVARRARIVLLAAEGCSSREIAQRLGVSTHTVSLWCRRFQAGGSTALMRDAPGRGRKVTVTADADARVRALLGHPPAAGRWTVRSLATALGISRASVHRVLKAGKVTLVGPKNRVEQTEASCSAQGTDRDCTII
jgi:transposase